jgi:hypothetical protein
MARGGRRTYARDSRGRFASAPGGGLGAARKAARSQSGRASTLGARTSLKASRAKLRAKDPADQRLSTALSTRAQKGAVTRGNRGLKAAKAAAQTRIAGGRKGVIGKPKGPKPGAPKVKSLAASKNTGESAQALTSRQAATQQAKPKTRTNLGRKAPRSIKLPTLAGVMRQPRIKLEGEGGAALRKVMSIVPVIPKGRKPLSKGKDVQMFDVGFSQPMRMGGRQRSALEQELRRQGFSARSNALGGVRTYSKQFAVGNKNPRTAAEIVAVQVQSKGGPLVGGTVSTRRTVFVPSRQRNVGGRLMERAYGLPVKAQTSTKIVRRKPKP